MATFLGAARPIPTALLSLATLLLAASICSADEEPEYYDSIQYLSSDGDWDSDNYEFVGCNQCGPSYCDQLSADIACMAKSMEAQGIVYDPSVTQFYQGNTHGGVEQEFEYGGKVDQFLILDGTKLGVWDGMTVDMHVETRFGEDVNREAAGLAPVNTAMLYPDETHVTAITNLTFTQALNDEWLVSTGKFNALDMFYGLYPETGRGVNTCMNTSILIPLALLRVFPLSFLGAGITKMHGDQVQGALTVYDPHDCATTSGFEDLGDNGANILGMWRFFSGTEELPGSHLFGFVGATGDYTSLDPAGFAFVPGQGLVVPQQSGSWAAFYILQQRLWANQCNPKRNVGMLSQWCIADENTCPFQWTGNVMLVANGVFVDRPGDSAGVGYFYTGLSSQFDRLVSPVVNLHDLNGVELYYDAAIGKMFHLTADLQVIEPAEQDNDTAVVFGLRGNVGF